MFTLIGKKQLPLAKAVAGDIIVIPKLSNARTGDTFAAAEFPVEYDSVRFPAPLHTIAMVPEKKGEDEKLMSALSRISEEDPTCQVEKDPEGRQLLVRCMGDVHLDHIINKMERKYGVTAICKMYIFRIVKRFGEVLPWKGNIKNKAVDMVSLDMYS